RNDIPNMGGWNVFRLRVEPNVSVRFVPDLVNLSGEYEVYTWYPSNGNATGVPYIISHSDGVTTVPVNQTQNSGTWFSLGTYHLEQGSYVEIDAQTANGSRPDADAIRFELLSLTGRTVTYAEWNAE